MRVFLAAEPDAAAQSALTSTLRRTQTDLDAAATDLRWTPDTNLHVTLHFLGEVDQPTADRLRESLRASLETAAFTSVFDRMVVSPPAGRPRVIWIAASEPGAWPALHLDTGGRIRDAGLPVEARRFNPHVTLGRVRDRKRVDGRELRSRVARADPVPVAWRVDSVTLFRSDLSGPRPTYDRLCTVPLRPAGREDQPRGNH